MTFWWKLLCQNINLTRKNTMVHIFTDTFRCRWLTIDGKHNKLKPVRIFSHFPLNHSVLHTSAWMITPVDVSVWEMYLSTPMVWDSKMDDIYQEKPQKVVTTQITHMNPILIWTKGFALKITAHGEAHLYSLISHSLWGDMTHPRVQYLLCKHIILWQQIEQGWRLFALGKMNENR